MNPKNPIRIVFLLAVVWSLSLPLPAAQVSQTHRTDSLVQLLVHSRDTSRIDLLLALTSELSLTDPRQAFLYGRESLDLAQEMKHRRRTGLAFEAIARIYTLNAVYEKALDFLLQARNEFEAEKDTLEIARCDDFIGYVYMSSQDFANARDYFQRSLKLNKKIRNFPRIAENYMHMGSNYIMHDSLEKGLSYYTVSLLIADSLNMQAEKVDLLNNIGYGYARLGKHEDALRHFYKVLELVGSKPDDFIRSSAMVNIARGYFSMKNYPASLKYALDGYKLSKSKRFDQVSRDASKILSDIHAVQGDYKQSYTYFVEYKNLSDSILNAQKVDQLARIQTLYELDRKSQENTSLRLENVQNVKSLRTRTLVILLIGSLVIVLLVMLFLLNRLNNKQLALNKKLAEQGRELAILNDQKDRFFSFVAHNLKNPFNTIMGFAELMQRTGGTHETVKARQYAGLIYDLSSQVQKVLSNLLEWSRLQRRTFECKPETVELSSLVKDVLEMNTREASRKDIHFTFSAPDNVYISADRSMITTVLQNLVSNAIAFTPSSGSISLECKVSDQQAMVSIADTGVGISTENLARLFNFDFSQAKVNSSDKNGAGLGLIICQEMLLKNNGSIMAESEPGKGSRFTFTLPALSRTEHGEEVAEQSVPETEVMNDLIKSQAAVPQVAVPEIQMVLTPLFDEVSRVLSIENLELFSKTVTETGERLDIDPLVNYGRLLSRLTRSHQIDQIIKVLPGFRKYLDNMRNLTWN
jgi:signal transduction histidine kinase